MLSRRVRHVRACLLLAVIAGAGIAGAALPSSAAAQPTVTSTASWRTATLNASWRTASWRTATLNASWRTVISPQDAGFAEAG